MWLKHEWAQEGLNSDDTNRQTPHSDFLAGAMKPLLTRIAPDADRWDQAFDEWELLLALLMIDCELSGRPLTRGPYAGRFKWRSWHDNGASPSVIKPVVENSYYAPLEAGLFGGDRQPSVSKKRVFA